MTGYRFPTIVLRVDHVGAPKVILGLGAADRKGRFDVVIPVKSQSRGLFMRCYPGHLSPLSISLRTSYIPPSSHDYIDPVRLFKEQEDSSASFPTFGSFAFPVPIGLACWRRLIGAS